MNLIGRDAELARLRALVDGTGGTLVISGRPGVGKSALLAAALDDAPHVIRTTGVQSEVALPFAALRDLVEPVLGTVDALPEPQRHALRAALALEETDGLDPGTVLHAFGALVAALSPVVIAVDDVQWLDASSRAAVAFVARRAARLGVVVIAVHSLRGEPLPGWPDLPTMALGDLVRGDALRLARRAGLATGVAEALIAGVGGNPLALVEAPTGLSDAQRSGREPLPGVLSAGESITRAYRSRLERLPAETRHGLLLAAASADGAAGPLAEAIGDDGLAVLGSAEDEGLVELDGNGVRFAHPEVRAAVYHSATPSERRVAHRTLAEVLPEHEQAWHLAIAADRPDEAIAAALERLAEEDASQGAPGTAIPALRRAVALTPDPATRRRRALAAGRLALFVGRPETTLAITSDLPPAVDPIERADTQCLVGEATAQAGRPTQAQALLEAEAERIAPIDPARASGLLTQAAVAMMGCGPVDVVAAMAARARTLAPPEGDLVPAILEASARAVGGEHRIAREVIMPRIDEIRALDGASADHQVVALAGMCLHWLEELDAAVGLMAPLVRGLRDHGAVTPLAFPLVVLVAVHSRRGDFLVAEELAREAETLGEEAIGPFLQALALNSRAYVTSILGDDDACRSAAHRARALSERLGIHAQSAVTEHSLGMLSLSRGELDAAILHFQRTAAAARAFGARDPGYVYYEGDLTEAYIRAGRLDDARQMLDQLRAGARRTGGAWATAATSRYAALLDDDDAIDGHLADAAAAHERVGLMFERARTQLIFGERLRRARRRSDARALLAAAAMTFRAQGAWRWADRADAELVAAGGRPERPADTASVPRLDGLTAREQEVCGLVAGGATNAEVAASLFVSPRTVEHHLRQIYRKIGVRSRSELAARLSASAPR